MSLSDESLFREVDEEVRRQKLQDLWSRWGNIFIAVSVVVILGVAGFKGWQYWQARQAEEAARSYFGALTLAEAGKADEAAKRFAEVAAGNHRGYALLARLNLAAQHAAGGRRDEAVKIYDEVAASPTADPNLRTAARLRAALLILDTAPREELVRRVGDFNTPDNVWRNQAREILALAAYRAKDFTEADKLMNDIVLDQEAPQDMRRRAQIMISLLAPQLDAKKPNAQ
jgi:hypothetical protein